MITETDARLRMDVAFGFGIDQAHAALRTNAEAKRIYDCAIMVLMGALEPSAAIPEGAAFFRALADGANFRWMELAADGNASVFRLDAQADLARLLHAAAKKVKEIEAMDAMKPEAVRP